LTIRPQCAFIEVLSSLIGEHQEEPMHRLAGFTLAVVSVVSLAGCDWTMYRGDSGHTGAVVETRINVDNVGSLREAWSTGSTGIYPAPAIANNKLLVVHGGHADGYLGAYDAAGSQGCAGSPKVCGPLWTAPIPSGQPPAVAGGVVYVAGGGDSWTVFGRVFAVDAAGEVNCSGTPRTCAPLWTAPTPGGWLSPATVAGGRVYVSGSESSANVLYAFDAAGNQGCAGTPKVCTPLWTADGGPPSVGGSTQLGRTPAVANGRVYVLGEDKKVHVYDAAGTQGCSGTPVKCVELFTIDLPLGAAEIPIVVQNRLYQSERDVGTHVFDAAGSAGCAGTPTSCSPLWTYPDAVVSAVSGGVAYASGSNGRLLAFDATGVNGCSGAPKTCEPLWTSSVDARDPSVGSGVVYAKASVLECDIVCAAFRHVYAFDATGNVGCGGVPKQCAPLLDIPSTTVDSSNPSLIFDLEVANGTLFASENVTVRAYTLP
jgi:hypothetical protein